MHRNPETVRQYIDWLATPRGTFAFERQVHLVERMTAHWPRRGRRLLDVGCGLGIFLPIFSYAGFDVSGCDVSPPMLAHAREHNATSGEELDLCDAAHLPYQDKEFHYSVLLTVLEFVEDPEAVLRETLRVTSRSLLITFLNRLSLEYLFHGKTKRDIHDSAQQAMRWFWPWEIHNLVQRIAPGKPTSMRSVLPGPRETWTSAPGLAHFKGPVYPYFLGSYVALRVDLEDERPLTPLHAFTAEGA